MARLDTRIAVSVMLMRENKVYVMRRINTGHLDGYYGFPAGHIEAYESPEMAAIRELKEEAGILVESEDLKFISVLFEAEALHPYTHYNFMVQPSQEPFINEKDKCDDACWIDMNDTTLQILPVISKTIDLYKQNIPYASI